MKLPKYQDWLSGSTRFLWIHGVPGSGKTVLLSSMAENVGRYCQTRKPEVAGWACYYCHFRRQQDETPHILRCVISSICRQIQHVPLEIKLLYLRGTSPDVQELTSALRGVLRQVDIVYLLVDGLDEAPDRGNVLNLLKTLSAIEFGKFRLAVTSRRGFEIERALQPIATDISLSSGWVDQDIRLYIENRCRDWSRLAGWSDSLVHDVQMALIKGAKGT